MEASTPPPTQPPASTPPATPPADPVAKSNKQALYIIVGLLAVVGVILAVVLLGGESKEDKALAAVCGARADIQKTVDGMVTTDFANFTLDQFKNDVASIQSNLKTIKDNEAELGVDRRQEVKQATDQFTSTIRSTAGSLLTSTSLNDAQEKLQTAASDLATGYRAALEPVDCSGVETE